MKKTIFTGSGVALITPFTENGIDYDALGRLIDYHIEHETDSIIIAGTTGEAATMTVEEHEDVLKFSCRYANGRIPIIAGTGNNDTNCAIHLSKFAEAVGADGLLMVTPYYNKTSQRGLVQHYNAIADQVDIPIILYNVPSRTGVTIKPETLYELGQKENIVAIKEASGDISAAVKMMQLCGDFIDIYSGNDDSIVPLMSIGGKGVISVLANIFPDETHQICQKCFEGDYAGATKLQLDYLEVIDALFCEVNPIPVKTAMKLMGMDNGLLRLPLYEMADGTLGQLKTALVNKGIKISD